MDFINLTQTKEERQEKYWLARSLGANSYWAYAMRDWRLSTIEQFFGLRPPLLLKAMPDGTMRRLVTALGEGE